MRRLTSTGSPLALKEGPCCLLFYLGLYWSHPVGGFRDNNNSLSFVLGLSQVANLGNLVLNQFESNGKGSKIAVHLRFSASKVWQVSHKLNMTSISSNGQGQTINNGLAMKIEADVYNTWEVENRQVDLQCERKLPSILS